MEKKNFGLMRMCYLNVGNLGQNYMWGLFFAFISPIFEYLGARPDQLSGLWLAGPIMGIIVQVVAGKWSDWIWTRFGRRRPFMLLGTVIVTICFFLMVYSKSLLFVMILFWIMMGAANLIQGPYRALLADVLPKKQLSTGFIIQFLFGGIGSTIAYCSPWILSQLGVSAVSHLGEIPLLSKLSFELGGIVLLVTMLISCFAVKEVAPENMEEFKKNRKKELNVIYATTEIFKGIFRMPKIMWQVCIAVFCSCFGAFLMNVYFSPVVAEYYFDAKVGTTLYTSGVTWAGLLLAFNGIFSVIFALLMPYLCKYMSLKALYGYSQALGGIAIISMLFISSPSMLIIPMIGVGIMQAGSGSIPFAIIGDSTKQKDMGLNMGIVNIFTTLPQLMITLLFGYAMVTFLGNNSLYALVIGGGVLVLSGIFGLMIQYKGPNELKLSDM